MLPTWLYSRLADRNWNELSATNFDKPIDSPVLIFRNSLLVKFVDFNLNKVFKTQRTLG
jgi:hypothetical protein